jgi:hypothetical protein
MWHRCTAELERVRQQLRAVGNDPVAIAHAAREGAGVLAAWSLALEGAQPGALARAARELARSAELPAYTPLPRKPVSRASGQALFMLATGKPDSAVGWMIVAQIASNGRARAPAPRRGPGRRGAGRQARPRAAATTRPGELERWYALSEERQRGRARSWLTGAGYRLLPATRRDPNA